MNKRFTVNKRAEKAVSEVIGTLLLLMIAVSLFSVLYLFVFSFETPDHSPSVSIIGYVDEANVPIFEHHGGESLGNDDISIILTIDGTKYDLSISANLNDTDGNAKWNIGEKLVCSSLLVSQGSEVEFSIVDSASNSIFIMGILQKPIVWANSAPTIHLDLPNDDATGVSLTPLCQIDVMDADISNQTVYVTWQFYDTDHWYNFGYNQSDNNMFDIQQTLTNASAYATEYEWRVVVKDNHTTPGYATNVTWNFKTIGLSAPTITSPGPVNGATGQDLTPIINATVNDADGNDTTIDWYYSLDNSSWTHFAHVTGHPANTSNSTTATFATSYNTKYYWNLTANDGHDNITSIVWNFTTNKSPEFSSESPSNNTSVSISTSLISVNITDPDGDNFDWTIECSNGDSSNGTGESDDTTCALSGLNYSTMYIWYVNATDPSGSNNYTRAVYTFTTEDFFDSFEDSEWNDLWIEDVQDAWYVGNNEQTNGLYSAECSGIASDATLTMSSYIDLTGKSIAFLNFSWHVNTKFEPADYIILEGFDGTSWNEIDRITGGPEEGSWVHESFDLLISYSSVDNFKIRFRVTTDKTNKYGYVDEVRIITS